MSPIPLGWGLLSYQRYRASATAKRVLVHLFLPIPPPYLPRKTAPTFISEETEAKRLNRCLRFHSYMWSKINQSPGNSKSSVTTTGILTYCKLFFTFQSITSFELCYQTRLDPTGKGLSAEERLDLGPRGWDWARTGPGWSRFKQKCANFSLTSKPVSVQSLDIFSTARVFETRDFYDGFIVVQVEALIWTAPDWPSEPRDAANIWASTVHTVRISRLWCHHCAVLWTTSRSCN